MKRLFLSLLVSGAVFVTSCDSRKTNYLNEGTLPKAEVKLSMGGAFVNSLKTGYNRGDAPAYISGVTITAKSNDFTTTDVVENFPFAETGGDDISFSVPVGNNEFSAVASCSNTPGNEYFVIPAESKPDNSITDITERAEKYAEIASDLKGIYAGFTSGDPVIKNISSSATNTVTINLKTEDRRVNFIIENEPTSVYKVTATLRSDRGQSLVSTSNYVSPGSQVALIANDSEVNSGNQVELNVHYYSLAGTPIESFIYHANISDGNVTTYLLKVENSTPKEASLKTNIYFLPDTSSTQTEVY